MTWLAAGNALVAKEKADSLIDTVSSYKDRQTSGQKRQGRQTAQMAGMDENIRTQMNRADVARFFGIPNSAARHGLDKAIAERDNQQALNQSVPTAIQGALIDSRTSGFDKSSGALLGAEQYLSGAASPQDLIDRQNQIKQVQGSAQFNPEIAMQAQMAEQQAQMLQQQQQVKAQGEAQTLENQLLRENAAVMKPLMAGRRSLSAARDLRTLTTEGGDVRFPGKSRGAYKALRFQGINAIRETTEAGALQAAEIEFFESIVPAYDDWIKLSDAERIAQNKELEYFFETKLRDDLQASGQGIDFAEFMGEGRTIDDILTPGMPDDFERVEGFTDPTAEVQRILSQPGALGSPQGTLPQIDLSEISTGFGFR